MDNNVLVIIMFCGTLALMAGLVILAVTKGRNLIRDLKARGITTTAQITGLSKSNLGTGSQSNKRPVYFVDVAYEVDGKRYRKAVGINAYMYTQLAGHTQIEVVYLPEKPKTVLLASQVKRAIEDAEEKGGVPV